MDRFIQFVLKTQINMTRFHFIARFEYGAVAKLITLNR